MKAACYVRVSKSDGSQSVENQRPDLEALASRRGLTIAKWYEETESAARRRPVFEAMLRDAEKGAFDVLLIWRLDRFGRSLAGNLDDVRRLDRAGVAVVSHGESWLDTTEGALRSLLVAIFSYVAQTERETLIVRTRAGLARARREGVRLGRPRASADKVRAGLALVAAGVPVARAARESGIGEGTLRRARAADPDIGDVSGAVGAAGGAIP